MKVKKKKRSFPYHSGNDPAEGREVGVILLRLNYSHFHRIATGGIMIPPVASTLCRASTNDGIIL